MHHTGVIGEARGDVVVLKIHFVAHALWRWKVPLLPKLLKIFNRVVFGLVLLPSVLMGKGVLLSYQGLGTVFHKDARIGDGAIISTGVTIGGRSGLVGAPEVGAGALVGTGAKLLGPIRIDRNASVGANAVVLHDVPDFAVVVGIPARIVRINRAEDIPDYKSFS